jgi:shikimate kinase
MPGCGKTTVGKLLAQKLNRQFFDTDDLIRETAGREITEIFREKGEPYFRSLETGAIRSLAEKFGCVIATGGGAVLNQENVDMLKMNGRIYFLDRSPELLIPTADRPLALDAEAVFSRYRERYEIYKTNADETVSGDGTPENVAEDIERRHNK